MWNLPPSFVSFVSFVSGGVELASQVLQVHGATANPRQWHRRSAMADVAHVRARFSVCMRMYGM